MCLKSVLLSPLDVGESVIRIAGYRPLEVTQRCSGLADTTTLCFIVEQLEFNS